ncbi:MAG: hypothetical protein FJ098_16720 [Deltaproteobacteria bacterium]|nr:hypothetical protein [Deltaproteobacteria bacterium]
MPLPSAPMRDPRGRPRACRRVAVRGVLAAVAWAALAAPAAAQWVDTAAVSAEASLAMTTVQGGLELMGSGAVLLGLTPRFSVGGGGSVLLGPRELPGSTRGTDQELRLAWGGLVVQLDVARRDDRHVWVRILGGAGNAKVDLAVVRTRIASDNFGVFVPEVGGSVRLRGPVRLGAALGYRAVLGVEDLPGLVPADLRGPSARVLLSVHPF